MQGPIIIEIVEVPGPESRIDKILKPKVASAKRISDRQKRIMEAYKLFQEKYVK